MCYNKNCRIEIISLIDGESSTISTMGKATKTSSGFCFDYALDGDECTITVADNKVVQSRRGEQNIELTFKRGEETQCFLSSGGFEGTFTVFTNNLQYSVCEVDALQIFKLSIGYILGEQKTEITFSAKYT